MINVISLGAGVQSSTLALMAAHGEITPMPECAIFADTMAEPQSVYRWLDWLETQLPFQVIRVCKGDLFQKAITVITTLGSQKQRTEAQPPFFSVNQNGIVMPMQRQCTREFKVDVIIKEMRRLKYKKQGVIQWIGISMDESHRMKPSRDTWIENRWPLIDLGMKRRDCLDWMRQHGYPEPPRSACVFCPYRKDKEWLRLKTEEPDDFQRAVEFEKKIQLAKSAVGFVGEVRLHRSMQWLDTVEFDPYKDQINLFGNECEGMCGV